MIFFGLQLYVYLSFFCLLIFIFILNLYFQTFFFIYRRNFKYLDWYLGCLDECLRNIHAFISSENEFLVSEEVRLITKYNSKPSQPAHDARTTLHGRCNDVKTLKWRCNNVVLALCVGWDSFKILVALRTCIWGGLTRCWLVSNLSHARYYMQKVQLSLF